MAWEKVAEAQITNQGIQGDVWQSIAEIPKGSQGLLRLDGVGLGPIFDAAGVEWAVQEVFDAEGIDAQVTDCYGEGWNTAYIQFKGSPIAIIPLLYALAAVLAALGFIFAIVSLTLFVFKPLSEVPGVMPLLAIGGLGLAAVILLKGGKKG